MSFLSQPYPFVAQTWKRLLISAILSGGFAAGVYVWAVNDSIIEGPPPRIIAISIGIIAFLVISALYVLVPKILHKVFHVEYWTVWKKIVWSLVITIALSSALYTYSHFAFVTVISIRDVAIFILLPMYFIVVLFLLAKFFLLRSRNLKMAEELNGLLRDVFSRNGNKRPAVHIHEAGKSVLNIQSVDFFYLLADGRFSYAIINEDGNVRRKLIRRSISSVSDDLDTLTQVVRSHSDYVINLENVDHFHGDAQGLKAVFSSSFGSLPISSKYLANVKDHLAVK